MPSNAAKIFQKQHKIDSNHISKNAIYVVQRLKKAGFNAFIVGGAVRDLILGIQPKDFDVSTNATPEEIQKLFPYAYLIGRRFQIVHVRFHHEIIEVSTFRGPITNCFIKKIKNEPALISIIKLCQNKIRRKNSNQKIHSRKRIGVYGHTINSSGQVIQDNIWGNQEEDAWRRDLTINAMYYDVTEKIIFDYHSGFQDILDRSVKIIGDPNIRFREDPIRMIRSIRFAAKLNFNLNEKIISCFKELHTLLDNVSPARLFDEILKLFLNGHAETSLAELYKFGFANFLLPTLPDNENPFGKKFISILLKKTDNRILEKNHVSPGFTFAGLLWPSIHENLIINLVSCKNKHEAFTKAIQTVLDKQTKKLVIPKRYLSNMRDIWMMQPRFEKKQVKAITSLLNHPKLRSGYDFLLLRSEAGEIKKEQEIWWTTLINASNKEKQKILSQLKSNQSESNF